MQVQNNTCSYCGATWQSGYVPDECPSCGNESRPIRSEAAELAVSNPDIARWIEIGMHNPWIGQSWDPTFGEASFAECATTDELRDKLAHGNWCTGTAFYFGDLCLIEQTNGGGEWLTIRHGMAFESISFELVIKHGEWDDLVRRLLAATPEQCKSYTY